RRRVEPVGAQAGAGEEAEQGPFAELGGEGAGVDAEHGREFSWRPVARGLAGDDRGDPLAAGGRLRRPGPGGAVAAGAAPAGPRGGGQGCCFGGGGGRPGGGGRWGLGGGGGGV